MTKLLELTKNLELRVLNCSDDEEPRPLLSPTTLDGCQFNEGLIEVFI